MVYSIFHNQKTISQIYPDDYWKMEELCKGHLRERVEIRFQENGLQSGKCLMWKVCILRYDGGGYCEIGSGVCSLLRIHGSGPQKEFEEMLYKKRR